MKPSKEISERDRFPWLSSSLLALVIVGLAAGAGFYAYRSQKQVVKERTLQALRHLVFYKTLRVKEWYRQCMATAESATDTPALKELLAKEDWNSQETRNSIQDTLAKLAKSKGFVAWGLRDGNGSLLSWSAGGDARYLATDHSPVETGPLREATMSSLHGLKGGPVHLDVAAPLVHPADKDSPWTAIFVVDPWSTVFAVMAFAPADFSSLETNLIQRHGPLAVYLTPVGSGKLKKPPLSVQELIIEGSPAYYALNGQILTGECTDYRGSSVLYATNYVPWVSWGVLGTIDEKDALSALRYSAWLATGVTLLAVLSAAAFLYAWWNRRHRLVTTRLVATISDHKATLQDTVHKLFTAQEEERKKISHQLHDELAQSLGFARTYLSSLESDATELTDPTMRDYLKRAKVCLDKAETDCRSIIGRYRPPELDRLGLALALRTLGDSVAPATFTFDIRETSPLSGLPQEIGLALFRIAQEALANVRKHAHATEVRVSLVSDQDSLSLNIEDNGQGFDLEQKPPALHFGLAGIYEQVGQVNGALEITSRPGQGTQVRVRIPLPAGG